MHDPHVSAKLIGVVALRLCKLLCVNSHQYIFLLTWIQSLGTEKIFFLVNREGNIEVEIGNAAFKRILHGPS